MNPWYLNLPTPALPKLKISRIDSFESQVLSKWNLVISKLKIIYTKIENYFKQNLTSTTEKKLLLGKILRNTRVKLSKREMCNGQFTYQTPIFSIVGEGNLETRYLPRAKWHVVHICTMVWKIKNRAAIFTDKRFRN